MNLRLASLHVALAAFTFPLAAQDDMTALGRPYTEDATLLPSSRDVNGRAAIERFFKHGPSQQLVGHSLRAESMLQDGNMIVEIGTWTTINKRTDGTEVTASGRYLVVWVKGADGRWRMQYDMWHPPVK